MFIDKVRQFWKVRDLRNSVLFLLAMLFIYRVAAHVPIPGVNVEALSDFFASNEVLGLISVFSGGSMATFSIVALGVGPYITSSIIFQLLAMIVPQIEALQKEGESGQAKINTWTRWLTVPLAMLQGYGMIHLLRSSGQGIIGELSIMQYVTTILTMTAGCVFLMWLGELISEKKIGNGISILIFANIVERLPQALQQAIVTYEPSMLIQWGAFALIAIAVIAGVVFITEGQRNLPVVYAKRLRGGRMFGGVETHLPLRVNMAGVIPIIFAISIVLFPPMIAQFFVSANSAWVAKTAEAVIVWSQNQWIYGISYFVLVFAFTYFYTAVVFHPDRVAENLQKQGGFIPGIRPGQPTADFIQKTVNRIMPIGAFFLAGIAVLPLALQGLTETSALVIGGTGLLIVVQVILEMVNQVKAQLTMREYDSI
jgi:preprotein translocase subunit SecY